MNKVLLFLTLSMFATGCSQDFDSLETPKPATRIGVTDAIPQIPTRSLEGAIYNESVDVWMVPQNDPYTLENFQKAYDNLTAKKSTQTLSRAVAGEFATAKKLSATHYALKIYPRTEEEQWMVEMMEDVQVVYIPFNYTQLTEEDVERLPQAKTTGTDKKVAAVNTFTEKNPNTIIYENFVSSDGTPVEPTIAQLPILYTVWPVEKPLPDDLEYVVDYEVYLPHAAPASRSVDALMALQNEAQMQALGYLMPAPIAAKSTGVITRAEYSHTLHGRFTFFDNGIREYGGFLNVPMGGLELRYQVGSNIATTVTDNNGRFSCNTLLPFAPPLPNGFSYSMPLTVIYKSSKWKITDNTGTGQLFHTISASLGLSATDSPVTELPLSNNNRMLYSAHRAANYFFNVQTSFPNNAPSGGLTIRVHNYSNPDVEGSFVYNITANACYINLYNNSIAGSNNIILGTALHELGHFAHYWKVGYNFYYNVHSLLKESFASYSGWYLGEAYLASIGWSKPSNNFDITKNARQEWYKELGVTVLKNPDLSEYSPLFIDLTDTFDQSVLFNQSTGYPIDWIEGVSPSVVWNIVTTSQNWAQCKSNLQRYVTSNALTPYLLTADYDYWFRYN